MTTSRWVLVANTESPRHRAFVGELRTCTTALGLTPEIVVVPWREIIAHRGILDRLPAFDRPALVRLESPGKDFAVTRLLLHAGASDLPTEQGIDWLVCSERRGELLRPGLWFRGFSRILEGLAASFAVRPHLRVLTCPLTVRELFDKRVCAARLRDADLPTPDFLPEPATNPVALLDQLRVVGWRTAYVKLLAGSSSMGIAAVQPCAAPPFAVTTMHARSDGSVWNTRRLPRVAGPDLERVLAFVLREGAFVQRGIPMAQLEGMNFDVRVVVIAGVPRFTVFRLSSQPMTNLYLGGQRGEPNACRRAIPNRAWLDALDSCAAAACLYPNVVVGIDLLFERGFLRHHILEMNAFGDFFPGLADERGRSIHRVEIEQVMKSVS